MKLISISSTPDWSPTGSNTGGKSLSSLTTTSIVSLSLNSPSETLTSKVYVAPPCSSLGVQVKSPSLVIDAPVGAPIKLKINVCAGISPSVAVAVKLISTSSSPDWGPIKSKTGASFTLLIVIYTVASFESTVPSLALYVKLSEVVSPPSCV